MLLDKIAPLSEGQKAMLEALRSKECDIVGLFGPTGTGKSLFSVAYGIDSILKGDYKRFVICKPIVDVVTSKEYTVAELREAYYELATAYLKDILTSFVAWREIQELIESGKVVIADTHYLRGRTFDDSLIFLDDAQCIAPESTLEVLMRVGRNSKFVLAGDPVFQKDPKVEKDGATVLREVLLSEARACVVDLGLKDIVRPGAKRGIKLLFEVRMRKRELNEVEQKAMEVVKNHAPDADIVTIAELKPEKERFEITSDHTPDLLIITKEGHLGRLIGRGGERISKVQEELDLKIRSMELTLDFRELVRVVHPVSWVFKHVKEADFAGPMIAFKVKKSAFGPFVGQRGFYAKFIDAVLRKLIGVGARAIEV